MLLTKDPLMINDYLTMNHLKDDMYKFPHMARQVMTTKQVKETLLATDNFIIACGRSWSLRIKNIGAGMKEVSLKPFES